MMKSMMPIFLSNLVETKNHHLIVESIKNGISIHIALGRTTKHVAAKELLGTLAFCKHASGRKVAKHLGLDRRCLY